MSLKNCSKLHDSKKFKTYIIQNLDTCDIDVQCMILPKVQKIIVLYFNNFKMLGNRILKVYTKANKSKRIKVYSM